MRVAVLGLGLIGGSIGMAARRARLPGLHVVGYDRDETTAAAALRLGAVDSCAADVTAAVREADVAFVATPVGVLGETVRKALEAAGKSCVVSDVGSTKRNVMSDFEDAATDGRLIGGHPLAGSEAGGIEHARADLFDGAAWCVTPARQETPAGETARPDARLLEADPRRARLLALIEALGASPVEIEPDAHDKLMAIVSHLPHILANLLILGVDGDDVERRLAALGPSFRDATRVAGASTAIWRDIYIANADMLLSAVEQAIDGLTAVAGMLASRDGAALAAWNERARARRDALVASAP